MMQPTEMQPTCSLDDLLAHAQWAERFARMLVHDSADDLAQDAWLAAIRRPPAAATQPRAWLATVMRNVARMRHRSETRRDAREQRSDSDSASPSAYDAVSRMQLQRRLAELVLGLDEARRTVVVLAFYEGKSAAEIARELELPPTTVRSRIASALDSLRVQLDGEAGGDRSKWQLALAPLVHVPMPVASGGLGGGFIAALVMCMTLATGVAAALWPGSNREASAAAPCVEAMSREDVPVRVASTAPVTAAVLAAAPARKVSTPTSSPVAAAAASRRRDSKPVTMKELFERVPRIVQARITECWQLANASGRDIKGLVAVTITIETTPIVEATLAFDHDNTITDREMLECLRENPLAVVDAFENLSAHDKAVEGPVTVTVKQPVPAATAPPPRPTDLPADTASPSCPAGTSVAGTRGVLQWCQRADGTKHGPQFEWTNGRLTKIETFKDGESTEVRVSP